MNDTKKSLVEEIADIFRATLDINETAPYQLEVLIGTAISRISQALISGESEELDEEMKIVGRGTIWKNTKAGIWEACRQDKSRWPEEGYVDFIAFSPSGSEEENG